jgi:hypothetical protein
MKYLNRPFALGLGACLLSAVLLSANVIPANANPLAINLSGLSVSTTLGLPQNVQAQATGDGRLQVSWSRPNLSVLQVLTGYVVKIVNNGTGAVVETDTVDGTTTSITSAVLPNGSYSAQVSTVVAGLISLPASSGVVSLSLPTSTPSASASPAPTTQTSAPATLPVIDVNLPVPAPTVSIQVPLPVPTVSTPQPTASTTAVEPVATPTPSATASTPTPSVPSGVPSAAPSSGTPVPQPTVTVVPGAPESDVPTVVASVDTQVMSPSEVQLAWAAPRGKFTHFKVKVEGKRYSHTFTTTLNSYRLKRLKPGAYMVHVSTCNYSVCTGWKSMRLASTVLPGQVKQLSATKAHAHTAVVRWGKPSANGGKAVKRYLVMVQPRQGARWGKTRVVGVSKGSSLTLTKLKAHTRYRVKVAGLNGNARTYTKSLAGKHSKYRYFQTR